MRSVSAITTTFEKLGRSVGQNQKLVIEGVGAAIFVPLIIMLQPATTTTEKKDQKVQATRLSLTAVIRKCVGLLFSVPIGIKIANMAKTGRLSGSMDARLLLNLKGAESLSQFLHKNNLQHLPSEHIKKIKTIFHTSQQIEKQKLNLDILDSSINDHLLKHNLLKDKRYSSPHKIAELKNVKTITSTMDKTLISLADDYIKVSQSVKTQLDASTRYLKELLSSKNLEEQHIKSLDNAIKPELSKVFSGYQFMMQWIGYLIAIPVSAEVINYLFKPIFDILFKKSSPKDPSGAH